jgi:hypothetical protein
VANPIFSGGRDSSMVYVAGIVGVPWQDITRRDAAGQPDIAAGLDAADTPKGGFMSPEELAANGVWDVILGQPETYVEPIDPLMVESIDPRSGVNPITGVATAPPGAGYLANPVNGHERDIAQRDNLQYACIFPLPQARDCAENSAASCDCADPDNQSPLCQAPNGTYGTTQYFAKAYPGRRQLALLKALGDRGVVGSICPIQLEDNAEPGFAFKPTFVTLVDAASAAIVR